MKSKTKKRPSLKIKKFADGGDTPGFADIANKNVDGISSMLNLGSGLLQSGEDPWKVNRGNMIGSGALTGAASGAKIGSAFGPEGTLIGGGIGALAGGISGIIGANGKQKQLDNYNTNGMINANRIFDNNLTKTNVNPLGTQIYKDGGTIHITPSHEGRFTAYKKRTGKSTEQALHSSSGHVRKMANFAKNASKWHHKYADGSLVETGGDGNKPKQPIQQTTAGNSGGINPNLPISPTNPLLVQKQDGSVGIWGNPLQGIIPIVPPTPPKIYPSDKAAGYSNNYYGGTQTHGQSVPTQHPSQRFADGGQTQDNTINIERGELQIDPNTGDVLRKYNGINPQTGGLYEPHAKKESKESPNNLVTADPGTFVITKALSKDYQDAIDNNDKMRQNTILMNIKNAKDAKTATNRPQFKYGSYVPKFDGGGTYTPISSYQDYTNQFGLPSNNQLQGTNPNANDLQPNFTNRQLPGLPISTGLATSSNKFGTIPQTNSALTNLQNDQKQSPLDQIGAYAPAIANIAQGLSGRLDILPRATINTNPYKNQIIGNMPKDINTDIIANEAYGASNAANKDIATNSNNSSVYRANRQQLLGNTTRNIANIRLQGQEQNNEIAGRRASIYNELGNQDIAEQNRVRDLNRQSDESAIQARTNKTNLFNTGLSQFQQTQNNQKNNRVLQDQDLYKMNLLKDLNPFAKYYTDLGGQDQTSKFDMGGTIPLQQTQVDPTDPNTLLQQPQPQIQGQQPVKKPMFSTRRGKLKKK